MKHKTEDYKISAVKIVKGISSIRNKGRPHYLCRNNFSVVLDDTTEPKFISEANLLT